MVRILMIIAPQNFRDEEYFEPKDEFEAAGYEVDTASTKIGEATGSRGGLAMVDMLLSDVRTDAYDTVVYVGGSGSYILDDDVQAHRIAQEFFAAGKLVNAICHAPIIVAKAGLLTGRRATVFSADQDELSKLGARYVASPVVTDDHFITADGPASATQFARTIIRALIRRSEGQA